MRIVPVPASALGAWLDEIRPQLESFAADGVLTVEDFIASIMRQERQLWVAVDDRVRAVLLTSLLADRTNTVLVTQCAGDGREDWLGLWDRIEEWALAIGSSRVEIVCRPGWKRDLAGLGFRQTHIVMEKRLV